MFRLLAAMLMLCSACGLQPEPGSDAAQRRNDEWRKGENPLVGSPTRRWANGIVPYYLVDDAGQLIEPPGTLRYWPASWVAARLKRQFPADHDQLGYRLGECFKRLSTTGLRFVPQTRPSPAALAIKFTKLAENIGGYADSPGAAPEGNAVTIANSSTFCHELMHKLGFLHTHQRRDRDRYVLIREDRIKTELLYAFKPYSGTSVIDIGQYDVASLMHYSSFAGTKDGCATILKRPAPDAAIDPRPCYHQIVNEQKIAEDGTRYTDPNNQLHIPPSLLPTGNDLWLVRYAYCHSKACGSRCAPLDYCRQGIAGTQLAKAVFGGGIDSIYRRLARRSDIDQLIDAALARPAATNNANRAQDLSPYFLGGPLSWRKEGTTVSLRFDDACEEKCDAFRQAFCSTLGGHVFELECTFYATDSDGHYIVRGGFRWDGEGGVEQLGSEIYAHRALNSPPLMIDGEVSWQFDRESRRMTLTTRGIKLDGLPALPETSWVSVPFDRP